MASRRKTKPRVRRRRGNVATSNVRQDGKSDIGPTLALYEHIYAVVRQIPRGRVVTYGQIAELAGIPGAPRVVGAAMRASVPEMGLPWQRVVGKRSSNRAYISIPDRVGSQIQRALLEQEGVEFSSAATIALDRFGWRLD